VQQQILHACCFEFFELVRPEGARNFHLSGTVRGRFLRLHCRRPNGDCRLLFRQPWQLVFERKLSGRRHRDIHNPTFTFAKKETWGYTLSTSGVSTFNLTQGSGCTLNFGSTTAYVNKTSTTAKDYTGRSLTKDVAAWWAAKPTASLPGNNGASYTAISDVLTLLGASAAAIKETEDTNPYNPNDPVAIQISYDQSQLTRADINNARMISIMSMDGDGKWVPAVSLNYGGHPRYVHGPWNKAYPVGTYGVDTTNHIAWAVVNHDSDFVVVRNF